jgi:hypothetical protein
VPVATLVSCIACAELASAVPISMQGVGVREIVFAALLGPHGISTADTTLLGLLIYAQVIVNTGIGAAVTLSSADLHQAFSTARSTGSA